ncbi:MAG: MFS transporter [Oscillospiraceae bacterium]|nr:MFS transporter [Oscillospiraceae bacterium]
MKAKSEGRIFNATFIGVVLANMIMEFSKQMSNVLVAKYANYLGATATMVGFVVGVFAYTALIFKVFSAPAIDTFNRKYILAGAMLFLAIAYVGFSFSKSVEMLIVFRLIQGIGAAFTGTCCLTLVSDSLPADKMGTGIGIFSLAQVIAQALAPTVGLSLASAIGYNNTFRVSSALMMTAVICALLIKVDFVRTKKYRITLKGIVAKPAILPASIILVLSLASVNVNSFLVIYAEQRGVTNNIGLYFTVSALTLLVTRPMIGKLSDRFGTYKVLIPSMICFAMSFVMISMAKTLIMFLLAAFVSAFGYGACHPAINSICMKCVPKDRRGAASSTNYIGSDLGNMIGPALAGSVADLWGYSAMWLVMTIPIFMAMVLTYLYRNTIISIDERSKAEA